MAKRLDKSLAQEASGEPDISENFELSLGI